MIGNHVTFNENLKTFMLSLVVCHHAVAQKQPIFQQSVSFGVQLYKSLYKEEES